MVKWGKCAEEAAMDFWQVIEARHSVRAFDPQEDVSEETIQRILEAAVRAPSAGNRQPWHFVVVRREQVRQRLAQAAGGQGFVAQAPVVIVVCTDAGRSAAQYGERGTNLYCIQDTAAAVEHILLAVTALGLGGCWVGAFDDSAAAGALQLSATLHPVAMIPIGVPLRSSNRITPRRDLSDVVTYVK
jgi:nitroreductase